MPGFEGNKMIGGAIFGAARGSSLQPGQSELELIHKVDLDQIGEEELRRIVGELSWKLNPRDEVRLYECLTEYPLFEVL